ncbi:hypothetical protein BOX15_Mlig017850g3, partial [Macrostomum lignano]
AAMTSNPLLRAVLLSAKNGVRLSELQSQYRALAGHELDLRGQSLQKFIQDCDEAYLRLVNGELVAFGRETEQTQHICSLIRRQKTTGGGGGRGHGGRRQQQQQQDQQQQQQRFSAGQSRRFNCEREENFQQDNHHRATGMQLPHRRYQHQRQQQAFDYRRTTVLSIVDENSTDGADRLVRLDHASGGGASLRVTISNNKNSVGRRAAFRRWPLAECDL